MAVAAFQFQAVVHQCASVALEPDADPQPPAWWELGLSESEQWLQMDVFEDGGSPSLALVGWTWHEGLDNEVFALAIGDQSFQWALRNPLFGVLFKTGQPEGALGFFFADEAAGARVSAYLSDKFAALPTTPSDITSPSVPPLLSFYRDKRPASAVLNSKRFSQRSLEALEQMRKGTTADTSAPSAAPTPAPAPPAPAPAPAPAPSPAPAPPPVSSVRSPPPPMSALSPSQSSPVSTPAVGRAPPPPMSARSPPPPVSMSTPTTSRSAPPPPMSARSGSTTPKPGSAASSPSQPSGAGGGSEPAPAATTSLPSTAATPSSSAAPSSTASTPSTSAATTTTTTSSSSSSSALTRPSASEQVHWDPKAEALVNLPPEWRDGPLVYGGKLDDAHMVTVPGYGPVPQVLVLLRAHFDRLAGEQEEGIFRIAPSRQRCNASKAELEAGTFTTCDSAHILGNLLKIWFRELTPNIMNECTEAQVSLAADAGPTGVGKLLLGMRNPHQSVMLWLLDFLCDIASSPVSKMGLRNLAIVFAPNIYLVTAQNPMAAMTLSDQIVRFMEQALTWRSEFTPAVSS